MDEQMNRTIDREGRDGRFARASCLILAAVLALAALALLLLPTRDWSAREKRALAGPPRPSLAALGDGRFMSGIDRWLQDQFPMRDVLVRLHGQTGRWLGARDNGAVFYGDAGRLFLYETALLPRPEDGRRRRLAESNVAELARFIDETLAARRPGIPVSLLVVPPAAAQLPELLPPGAPVLDAAAWMARIREAIASPELRHIDIAEPGLELEARAGRMFASDHHWTSAGAFAAAQRWAEETGRTPPQAADFEARRVLEGMRGSLSARAPLLRDAAEDFAVLIPSDEAIAAGRQPDPHTLRLLDGAGQLQRQGLYDEAALVGPDPYLYYLGGNEATTVIETGRSEGGSLLVVRDSFANAFVPFVLPYFERVVLVDVRHGHEALHRALEDPELTELMVLYSLSQLMTEERLYQLNG